MLLALSIYLLFFIHVILLRSLLCLGAFLLILNTFFRGRNFRTILLYHNIDWLLFWVSLLALLHELLNENVHLLNGINAQALLDDL